MLFRDSTHDDLGAAANIRVQRVVCDEEALPFPDASFDMVLSSMSLHWCNDLPGIFTKVRTMLKPNGVFVAAMPGGDTLHELRVSLALAEKELESGIGIHISPMVSGPDAGNLLSAAGFAMTTVDIQTIVYNYSNMDVLMRHLQGMGENAAATQGRGFLSRKSLQRAREIYKERFEYECPDTGERVVPATFEIVHMIGWAPHESQQKCKPRGSGTVSLKDIDKDGFLQSLETIPNSQK
eukprot:c17433_g1_i2.p1 GENE.c17433_g1_i2~~c17433_g1_i2.p1  ORF type:complete len:238 (+),score=45.30 c17433_g1_i2:429-1142(+)